MACKIREEWFPHSLELRLARLGRDCDLAAGCLVEIVKKAVPWDYGIAVDHFVYPH